MKDKMKAHVEKKMGAKMDKLAELAVDMFLEKMHKKLDCMESKQDAMKKLHEIMKSH